MNICNFFHFINWTAISSITALIVAVRGLPQIDRWLRAPKIKLSLCEPTVSNDQTYWHIEITNSGGTAKDLALYVVASRDISSPSFKFRPRVRLLWPYENPNLSIPPVRDIQTHDLCDIFSTEATGKFHVELLPHWLNQGMETLPLEIQIKAFAENYDSSTITIKVDLDNTVWKLQQV